MKLSDLGLTFLTLPLVIRTSTASGPWCYDLQDVSCGPLHWKDMDQNCGGNNQSPINIERRKTIRDRSLDEISFEGYDQAPAGRWTLLNDGHTGDPQISCLHSTHHTTNTSGWATSALLSVSALPTTCISLCSQTRRNEEKFLEHHYMEAIFSPTPQFLRGGKLRTRTGHFPPQAVTMSLDGATVVDQINITKGGLRDTYRALQFHFHWGDDHTNGSEHAIDGRQYPMELHLVHMNIKYKAFNEAKGHPNGLAVLSFLFKMSETDNTNYDTIVAGLKNITQPGLSIDLASTFPLSILLPNMAFLSKYYRYKGSLTTPGCEEVVSWTVFEEQIPISKPQFNAFINTVYYKSKIKPTKMSNNFRPLQPLKRRKVYASRDASISRSSPLAVNLLFPLLLAFVTSCQLSGLC
ncbi:carbonic anhydrase 15-like isoform X2 [Paroedura picta]|uniref:carbonic anhydrase 15-like isoform X2 n=1 Tax=Paroedura picta TaxID=143630 RepID=UPI00405613BE